MKDVSICFFISIIEFVLFGFQHCSNFSPELLRHLVDGGLDDLLDDWLDPVSSLRATVVTVRVAAGSPPVSVLLLALRAATVVVSPPLPSLIVSLTGMTSPVLFVSPMSGPGPGPLSTFLSSSASAPRSFSSLLWLLILRV